MLLDEVDELFKTYLPYYLLIFLPIFIIISPTCPVSASYEFPAYRMQQYDLNGVAYGSRGVAINLEAKSLNTWTSTRHCVITHLTNLTIDKFRNLKNKAGALLVLFPENLWGVTATEKRELLYMENKMLYEEAPIPVYFLNYNPTLHDIINELEVAVNLQDKTKSAAEAMFSSIAGNGYQVTIHADTSNSKIENKISSIHGHLTGQRSDLGTVPTIVIVAYYDTFGITPNLSFGADSNGSGLIILLELIRIFSEIYSDPKKRGKFNLVFMVSGGGKFNFQGSRKWLEEQLDSGDVSLIPDTSFVICLDTLATSDTIRMHVSKPPKEGSPAQLFYRSLELSAKKHLDASIEGVHKKINLADDTLAWEHERYSIRRLSAFTLSCIKSPRDPWKSTILDTKEVLNEDRLIRNAKIIADALGNYVLNDLDVNENLYINRVNVQNLIKTISLHPRSAQLLTAKDNPLLVSLQEGFKKHLNGVKSTYNIADKRDPDFQFYGSTSGTLNIYRIKPAIFDLFLTLVIAMYLGAAYLLINFIPFLYNLAYSVLSTKKIKSN